MADSNITKRALAAALKELMEEKPFAKINVGNICEKCDMNRKSFYYHFKDKYDLVNWIFDTEFIFTAKSKDYDTAWDFMEDICGYFYANREFYRKALQIKGQNSFSSHFREFLMPLIAEYLLRSFAVEEVKDFYIDFFGDAFLCAIERWILQKDCIPSNEFVELLKECVQVMVLKITDTNSDENNQSITGK